MRERAVGMGAHVLAIAQRNGVQRIGFEGNEKFAD